jgi:hypothetical protein
MATREKRADWCHQLRNRRAQHGDEFGIGIGNLAAHQQCRDAIGDLHDGERHDEGRNADPGDAERGDKPEGKRGEQGQDNGDDAGQGILAMFIVGLQCEIGHGILTALAAAATEDRFRGQDHEVADRMMPVITPT